MTFLYFIHKYVYTFMHTLLLYYLDKHIQSLNKSSQLSVVAVDYVYTHYGWRKTRCLYINFQSFFFSLCCEATYTSILWALVSKIYLKNMRICIKLVNLSQLSLYSWCLIQLAYILPPNDRLKHYIWLYRSSMHIWCPDLRWHGAGNLSNLSIVAPLPPSPPPPPLSLFLVFTRWDGIFDCSLLQLL